MAAMRVLQMAIRGPEEAYEEVSEEGRAPAPSGDEGPPAGLPGPFGRRAAAGAAVAALAALMLCGAVVAAGPLRSGLRQAQSRPVGLVSLVACPPPEVDVDIIGDRTLNWLRDAASVDACHDACMAEPGCRVWVWAQQNHVCILKELQGTSTPKQRQMDGVVSGFACKGDSNPGTQGTFAVSDGSVTAESTVQAPAYSNVDGPGQEPWFQLDAGLSFLKKLLHVDPTQDYSPSYSPELQRGQAEGPPTQAGAGDAIAPLSMYCFSLMVPTSTERDLMTLQYNMRWSIFACDATAVFTNEVFQLGSAPGITTSMVNSDLKCEIGGDFGTALNTNIFLAVWDAVIQSGAFMNYAWTVKVDPDAVFLPDRLRQELTLHSESEEGVYLDNCKYGLHGPLEVFSRNAVQVLAGGKQQCVQRLWEVCKGPCPFGEDMFVDKCLGGLLGVRRDRAFGIMSEEHCDSPQWSTCKDPAVAVFHPFKTPDGYKACVISAGGA